MIFPFSKKMADVSEQCSGMGGKVMAEHQKVVRTIVEEVRRLEEAAAVEAAGGSDAPASSASRRLLHRDIDTDPNLPGRKEGARQRAARGERAERAASSAGMGDEGGSGLTSASGGGSAPRAQRFDLAASLADTDAQIAALMNPTMAV